MIKYILTIGLFCFSLNSICQDKDKAPSNNKTTHFVGLHAGSTTGYGFSYRYWPSKWGMQITGIPIFSKSSYTISTGFSILYKVKDNNKVDLYSYLGTHLIFDGYDQYTYDNLGNITSTTKQSYVSQNLGIGFGFQFELFEVLDFNIQTGYGFYDIINDFSTNIAGEIGLYYHL